MHPQMGQQIESVSGRRTRGARVARYLPAGLASGVVLIVLATGAPATSLYSGEDVSVRWDNTVKLGSVYDLHDALPNASGYCTHSDVGSANAASSNTHYCGYASGFRSGRLDWLSELDVDYRGFGLHASSAAWYDVVDNDLDAARDASGRPATDASELGGRNIELFEAFIHGTAGLTGGQNLSFRVGRHTLVWGESLYFAGNGIAAGQAPVDNYMVQATSGYEAKNIFLPVGQASFTWQAQSDLAIEGYYQFEWRRSRIDPDRAYAGAGDVLGAEGNHLIGLAVPGRGMFYYNRLGDQTPGSTGQYGLSVKSRLGDLDYGLYALRFNAKSPIVYYYPPGLRRPVRSSIGAYSLEYPKGIEIYGASVTGPVGAVSFGAEISARRNMPLVTGGIFVGAISAGPPPDNDKHPRYPIGNTLHAQLSWVYEMPPIPALPGGASWTGEVAANSLLETTANTGQLTPGRTRTAAAFRTVFEPKFFQLFPRTDVTVPIGLGYNFVGLSQVDPTMNRGTGDIEIGVTVTIDRAWKGAVNFTHYFGRSKNAFDPFGQTSGGQPLDHWDFIGMTVQRTF